MWAELIKQHTKWVGGTLIDHGDSMDMALLKEGMLPAVTTIQGFKLTADYFEVIGEEFNCGGARSCLGLAGVGVENGLALSGYGGQRFDIVKA